MAVKIVLPGAVMTVQDGGRYGYQETGIQVSGAMDQASFKKANYLVGNDETEAVLEVTLFEGCRTYLAFAGGIDVPLVMGSRSTNLKCAFGGYGGRALKSGDVLKLGKPKWSFDRVKKRRTKGIEEGKIIEVRAVHGPQ